MPLKIASSTFLITLVLSLTACGQTELDANLQKVKQDSLNNFIFVEGGTFIMGDFGVDKEGKHLRLTIGNGMTPHQVTLSSYSLGKYQVTWFDYDTYLLATKHSVQKINGPEMGKPFKGYQWEGERTPYEKNNNTSDRSKIYYYLKPASVPWQDAKDYCQWLGKELNLPIDLATEAQWEYAARDRGKKVIYANATSTQPNPPKFHDFSELSNLLSGYYKLVPIGTYSTPNGLGFYDMDNNGLEWVNDWYSESYYQDNPEITNPQGPVTGEVKVMRSWVLTIGRGSADGGAFETFRCALNSDKPIQHK